jgi:hypothetical protein
VLIELINSYRQKNFNDAILFSVDFPGTRPKDCYCIIEEGDTFRIKAEKERQCCGDGQESALAIVVSSHGTSDVMAVLKRDGMEIMCISELTRRTHHASS